MNESQAKRRGWIKNIVILFLVALLILTLFSNTILNHSLPEVAVQYPQYATIASRIRQTATVEANQSYSVTIDQTRIISSVEVRVGQNVKKGDILFRLEEGDSSELDAANRTLQDLNIQLIQKLKADPTKNSSSSSSVTDAITALEKSLRTAEDALTEAKASLAEEQEKLAELQQKQAELPGYDTVLNAKNLITQIDANMELLSEEIQRLQGKQGQLGGDGYYTPEEIEQMIADAEETLSEMNRNFGRAFQDYDKAGLAQLNLEKQVEAAKESYNSAKEAYDDYAATSGGGNVSYETVQQKQKAIADLQAQLQQKQMYFTEAEYQAAYNAYTQAKNAFDSAYTRPGVTEEELNALRTALQTASAVLQPLQSKYQEIQNLKEQISAAQQDYWRTMMDYSQSSQTSSTLESLKNQMEQKASLLESLQKQLTEAEKNAADKKKLYEEAKIALDDAEAYQKKVTGYREYDSLGDSVKQMKKQLADMEAQKAEAQKTVDASADSVVKALEAEIRAQSTVVTLKNRNVSDAQKNVTELKDSIAEARAKAEAQAEKDAEQAKLDNKQYQIELAQIRDKIRSQQALISRLEENQTDGTVVSPVSGVIESLSVSAGKEAQANTPIASIILSDMGYTMKCTLSSEQASRIKVGDVAALQWYYWGAEPTVRVVSIKADTQSQGQNKIVTMEVTGEVSPGTSLTFTLGDKNTSYDCVVPNSAVREDSEGKFVLVVTAKDTPLGSRYTARRVEVEVLASDETNSAVSGAISGEYVITTSSTPISSGMQVRLSENG